MKLGDHSLLRILEALGNVIPSDLSAILDIEDSEHLKVRAALGDLATEKLRNFEVDLSIRPQMKEALRGNDPFLADHEQNEEPDTYDEIIPLPGEHSCVVVPLRTEQTLVGAMTLDSVQCDAYSKVQLRAIKGFAQLAARVIQEEKQVHQLSQKVEKLALENASLRGSERGPILVGKSKAWQKVVEAVKLVAPTPTNVMISGDTGTGKEHVARAIHQWSSRSAGPFVAVNCAVLVPELALSVLFGHEKGAFTGADRRRPGRFELAAGGTLFLDEIGELPLPAQAQLLRVVQEKTFERVGGTEPIQADVRLVAATNRDLAAEARTGTFREDLFYRLNSFPIYLPPLRHRDGDITLMTGHLLQRIRTNLEMPDLNITTEALRKLETYHWPGNVRELGNILERASILAQGKEIQPENLEWAPNSLTGQQQQLGYRERRAGMVEHGTNEPEGYVIPKDLPRLHRVMSEEILRAIVESEGRISGKEGAAERLGLPPTTVRSMIQRFKLKAS